jgi:prepilin-type N-terminal cleavage/methylation domain-containing protein
MKKGFTLIELLVAVGIFTVILGIIFTFFNPIEFAKRQRDIKRINDLNSLASAIETCIAVNPNCNLGEDDNFIYISVPSGKENIPSTTTDATGKIWFIHTVTSSDLYNINGTGWLPVDFSSLRYSPLSSLPVDPINSFSQKYFYSYVFNKDAKEFEINANLEYSAFRKNGRSDKTSTDGGSDLEIYEVGNNKCLIYNTLYGDITTTTCGYIQSESENTGTGGELINYITLTNVTGTIEALDLDDSNLYFVGWPPGGVAVPDWIIGKADFDLSNLTITTTEIGLSAPYRDAPLDVKIKGDNLYIGGRQFFGGPEYDFAWRIEKRDKNFNLLSEATSNPYVGIGPEEIEGLAVDDNNLFLVGNQETQPGISDWRIEVRGPNLEFYTATSENLSSGDDEALDVALDDNYIYVVGYYTSFSPATHTVWRIEKRDKSLNLISATDTCVNSSFDCKANAIAIDDSYLYIAGQYGGQWRVEKRNKSDLSLVWAQTIDPTSYNDIPYGIAVDCEGVYIAGTQSVGSNPIWRIEKRNLYTGTIDWATTSSYGNAKDIAVNDQGVFIVGDKNGYFAIEKRNRGAPKCNTTFNEEFDNMLLYEAATTSDGYYLIGGSIIKGQSKDALVLKLYRDGKIATSVSFGGNKDDGFGSLIVDGDYFVGAGYTYSFGTGTPSFSNAYIVKASATSGTIVWQKYFGSDNGDDIINQIKKAPDGNYIATGYTTSTPYNYQNKEVWVVKINSNTGNIIWQTTSNIGNLGNSIDITNDGNYIVGGGGWRIPPYLFIMKINSSTGDVICSSTDILKGLHGNSWSGIGSIIQTFEGYYLAVYNEFFGADWYGALIKISECDGAMSYRYLIDTLLYDVIQNKDGKYAVMGDSWRISLSWPSILLAICPQNFKSNEIGTQEPSDCIINYYPILSQYGVTITDGSLIQTPDGGYLLVGYNGATNFSYVIKTDSNGNAPPYPSSPTLGFKIILKKFFGNILKALKALFYSF